VITVKFRPDNTKVAAYYWHADTNRLRYTNNKQEDKTNPIDVSEETKEAEELKELSDDLTCEITTIKQTQFNKFPSIDTLEPSDSTSYKISEVMAYTKKKKDSEEPPEVSYAIQLVSNGQTLGIYKQNKFVRDVLAKSLDESGRMLKIVFKIPEKKYYPGDKKGRLNTVEVITQRE
jgi:hypothetical protein